jgi:hypothetical protein
MCTSSFRQVIALVFILILSAGLIGCQTVAERQAANITQILTKAETDFKECTKNAKQGYDFTPLAKHFAGLIKNGQPNLEGQVQDYPTPEEANLLAAFRDHDKSCEQQFQSAFSKIDLRLGKIVGLHFSETDNITNELIASKYSYADAIGRYSEEDKKYQAMINGGINQLVQALATSHYNELAQRQQAANAFAQGMNAIAQGANAYSQQNGGTPVNSLSNAAPSSGGTVNGYQCQKWRRQYNDCERRCQMIQDSQTKRFGAPISGQLCRCDTWESLLERNCH